MPQNVKNAQTAPHKRREKRKRKRKERERERERKGMYLYRGERSPQPTEAAPSGRITFMMVQSITGIVRNFEREKCRGGRGGRRLGRWPYAG